MKIRMFYCALYQNGVEIKERLRRSLKRRRVKFLPFSKFVQLESLIQKYILDLVVVAGADSFVGELNLTKRIKKHPILSLAPLVLYHPHPKIKVVLAGFDFGADEFFFSKWNNKLFSSKLKMIINRSRRDLGVNPTTRLPGTCIIEREISKKIKRGKKFAACYADLDNFKAYNDYYGYHYGDGLIKITSEIIRDVVYSSTKYGFVGHIGGDDFVFIIPPEKIHAICNEIIKIFDRMIIRQYQKEDILRGYIVTTNRRGEKESYPIMTLSIAVVVNQKKMFRHLGEISHMIADLKSFTKTLSGSNYFIERRKKY
ncbi:MAG: GGDEF domain-containing protein [candidate division Zixibacteria bacterium]|nr:GGDEF domain-containing protein [candidate division Zixibacteria bacterium]